MDRQPRPGAAACRGGAAPKPAAPTARGDLPCQNFPGHPDSSLITGNERLLHPPPLGSMEHSICCTLCPQGGLSAYLAAASPTNHDSHTHTHTQAILDSNPAARVPQPLNPAHHGPLSPPNPSSLPSLGGASLFLSLKTHPVGKEQ